MVTLFPQTSSPRVQKLYCMCLKTTKQWSKWSWKEGDPQWDTFPEPTELLLVGHSIESIWTPKIQIRYIDTKNQLADILTKGNFTRYEWNHLLCLFNISHFSSTVCSEAMVKRVQQDSGEERVTAKSRPMMSLIARAPSNVSSSVSPGKRSYGNENPWVRKLRERRDRGIPLWAATKRPHLALITINLLKVLSLPATQSGMITKLGLLKSGNLTLRCVIERSNPLWPLGERHASPNQVSFTRRLSTMEQHCPLWTR